MKRGFALTLLIAILVFGAFLRITNIHDESLWLDEGITYYNSTADGYGGVWDKTAKLDQSPPGYYFFMHTYLEIFGENEFGFRLIPLVFGVLSILFLYLMIAEMFEREVGLFAALILAINPFHIGFSVESRMYVMLSLFALIAFYSLYKAMKSKGLGIGWWVSFILSCIVGTYTHNFFFFVLLALAFIFILLMFNSERSFGKFLLGLLSAALVVIAYLPWLDNFLKQLDVERYWMATNSLSNLKEYFLDFSNGNSYLLLGLIGLSLIGLVWTFFRYKNADYGKVIYAAFSLLIFIVIGIGAPLIYSLSFEPIMKIRYMVYILPVWIGLVSLGIFAIRRLNIVFAGFIVLVITYTWMPWQSSAYPIELGEDYRGLVDVVLEDPAPVVVHTPSIAHVINFYNRGRFDLIPFPFSDDLNEYNIGEDDKSKFRELIRDYQKFYLVITHSHEEPHGLLYVWSDGFCTSSYEINVEGMEVYFFEGCT